MYWLEFIKFGQMIQLITHWINVSLIQLIQLKLKLEIAVKK